MPATRQEIIDYVSRLTEEEFHLLQGAVTALGRHLKPSILRRMPLEERCRVLAGCAEDAAKDYDSQEWEQWHGGDILESD